jgi:MFS family permease
LNAKLIWKYLRFPFIFKPLVLILLVIIAPGVDNAMFYYNTSVLKFDNTEFANISVISQLGSIFGQQFYRLFCKDMSFKRILTISTILYSIDSALKLLIICDVVQNFISPVNFTYIISGLYTFINSIHLMPIMVLACDMCPKDMEATFYSFILAIINVGYLLSYQIGGLITYELNIEDGSFTNLWLLILIASIYPLLNLPLMCCLLPSQKTMESQFQQFR